MQIITISVVVFQEDLDKEQLNVLKRAFDAFAAGKGYIEAPMVGTILSMLGHDVSEKQLKTIIDEVDADDDESVLKSPFEAKALSLNSYFLLYTLEALVVLSLERPQAAILQCYGSYLTTGRTSPGARM
ncbi:hypothetical protein J6590_076781 [Homalodisca vitripennis]|nr:hypothetical protein J6590_076781 [Homalodisca vitripennis]